MRICVEKNSSGMYPSIPKRTCLDTADLNQKEQIEIQELIRGSNFFNLSNSLPDPNAADFTTYRITIETDDKKHSVTRTNFSMDNNLALLVKRVIKAN